MLDLLEKGGPLIYFLVLCSVVGVYVVIQKILFLYWHRISNSLFVDKIKHSLLTNGKTLTLQELRLNKKIMVKGIASAIDLSDLSRYELKEALKETNSSDVHKLEKNISILSSIITIAPILGLLGTVLGLMDIFNVISGGAIGDSSYLSRGIAQALITTVVGLSIAIPLVFFKAILTYKIEAFISDMESILMDIAMFCKQNEGVKP